MKNIKMILITATVSFLCSCSITDKTSCLSAEELAQVATRKVLSKYELSEEERALINKINLQYAVVYKKVTVEKPEVVQEIESKWIEEIDLILARN